MGRLTQDQADRLVAALEGRRTVTAGAPDPLAHRADGDRSAEELPADDRAERVRALLADAAALEELGRSLTLDLAAYLRRPVRCSAMPAAASLADPWRFEADIGASRWWIDLDADLAIAFADAMIGGDGSGRTGRGKRVRALAAIVVARMFRTIAASAGIDAPRSISPSQASPVAGAVLAAGSCAVAVDRHPWLTGVAAARETLETAVDAPQSAPAEPLDADEVLRAAIAALSDRLIELTHSRIAATSEAVERIEGSAVAGPASTSLGLALTAGGNGAVVAFADAAAVHGIACAAVGAPFSRGTTPGEVVLAAAEAVVRDALERAALRLPALARDGHRVVRLTDDPLTARTPHHAVDVRLSIEGSTGTLRVLVPSWMLGRRTPHGA